MADEKVISTTENLLNEAVVAKQSITSEEYARGLLEAHSQVVIRNALLTNLMQDYVASNKQKRELNRDYKAALFYMFIVMFALLTIGLFVVLVRVDLNSVTTSVVISLVSVGATYVGSIFAAYEAMFKYLFPVDEEKDMISMIKTVIENDMRVEEFVSNIPPLKSVPPKGESPAGK